MRPLPWILVLSLAAATGAYAAQAPPPAPADSLPAVRAARTAEPIVIDGDLSEPVWQNGNGVTRFRQREPVEGAEPTQRTEVRVAYDDDAIYVGARLHDTAPDSILARLSRRDVSIPADRFSVYLDPFHDKRSGYYFMVNAAGTLFDGTLSNDGREDDSWDGVWEGKARRDGQGWTAELRIPYSQLRFQESASYVWGVNFRRVIPRHNEEIFLVYQPRNGSGFVSRFPDLVGIESVSPGRSLEIVPYVTSKAAFLPSSSGDPFTDGSDFDGAAGGDLRAGIGSRLTLNATVNPDFGQVEVDPAVVNLSDVETFYPEKRPFFVEGASNFRFGNEGANDYWSFNWPEPMFFYSRRVGRAPQGDVPDADYSEVPAGTTILGAAKLTGKLSPSWNFGGLGAVTGREQAQIYTAGATTDVEVEPVTFYGAARALKEFPERRRGLGLMGTAVARSFDQAELRDQLPSASLMAGLDGWLFLDAKKNWVVSGWSALTQVRGDAASIAALQQNPRHYFQKPDAGYVELDPNATSLTGYGARAWLNRQNGNTLFNSGLGFMSPGFDVNDIGFQSYADIVNAHVGGGYRWTKTTKHRKLLQLIGATFGSADFGGNVTSLGLFGEAYTQFINNYEWDLSFVAVPETRNNRRTRGGPLTRNLPGFEINTFFATDASKPVHFYLEGGYETYPKPGTYFWRAEPGVEWKPASNVTLGFGPEFERLMQDVQYLGTVADPTATATYGYRYVFGRLDQTELSGNFRVNWAFSPTLSLQLYVQPLISTGDYLHVKELARPDSYDFRVYQEGVEYDPATGVIDPDGPSGPAPPFEIGQPDFNYVSLRGNAVLRWEFRPGSALFLVWTQNREDEVPTGDFDVGSSLDRMSQVDAENVFMAKLTYYFGL